MPGASKAEFMENNWKLDQLTIRYAYQDDVPDLESLLGDPDVCEWLWFGPLSPEGVRAYFVPIMRAQAEALSHGALADVVEFVVRKSEDGSFVGHGACVAVDGSPQGIEIGFALRKKYWRQGYGTMLGRFLMAFACLRLRAARVEAGCLAGNVGSERLLLKLGLRKEGIRSGYRVMRGERRDECIFGALREDLDGAGIAAWARMWGI